MLWLTLRAGRSSKKPEGSALVDNHRLTPPRAGYSKRKIVAHRLGLKRCPPSKRLPALPPAPTSVAWSFMNSQSLTQEERRTCIAAGSKLRSRPRLGQSGPLNGQHYSIRRDYSTPAAQRPPEAKSSRNPLQTKGISRSTSDRYRTSAGPLPKQHACTTGRAGKNKPGRASRTPGKQKGWAVSRLHRPPRVTQSTRRSTVHPPQYRYGGRATGDGSTHHRGPRVGWPARRRAGSSRGTALAPGRAACRCK